MRNKLFNGLLRGITNRAGQVIASVIITSVLGSLGIDNDEDVDAENPYENEDLSNITNENTDDF